MRGTDEFPDTMISGWQIRGRAGFLLRMKTSFLLALCSVFLAAPLHAENHTPLGEQMEQFNDAYKALRKEKDAGKAAALAREAQLAVARSLAEMPEIVTKMADGPEKSKAAAEYRLMMGKVYVSLCEVESAFLAGKTDEAVSIIEGLRTAKKEGHDKFMEE